jgi:UDP-N-acetylmuramoyl-L-alanyl-D-glutamate--2,6-diaminopimelate ligase
MGNIAESYSDKIIITSDNPRSESQQQIAHDILKGIDNVSNTEVILDRETAIKTAITSAEASDWILLAGKGHETTQKLHDRVIEFNDFAVAQRLLS